MPSMHELDSAHCEQLLRSQRIGRVCLQTPHGVEVVPVNYAVHQDAVVVRTARDGLLARFAHGTQLAFEVDAVDQDRWSGWSVVARGVGELRDVPPTEVRGVGARPRPWADGERNSELRLAWNQITGRRIGGQQAVPATHVGSAQGNVR
jgi:hypothetical protein